MKRLLTGMLAAALVLSLGVTSAFAAGRGGHHSGGYNFVDADGDGVCDNYGQRVRPMDGTGRGHGCGR